MPRRYSTLISSLLVICIIAPLGLYLNMRKENTNVINNELRFDERLNIWFPKNFSNEDKENYLNHKGEYNELLVYIDSLSCTSCQIKHLYKWQQFAEEIEKTQSIKVVPIILMSPRNSDVMTLKFEYYNSIQMAPVIIRDEELSNINPWMKSIRGLSVMLLSQERRIIKIYK